MAVAILARFDAPDGSVCTITADYNAQNGRIRAIVCANNTSRPAYAEVTDPDTGEVYGQGFAANSTTERSVPQGVLRIRLTFPDAEQPNEYALEVQKDDGTWTVLSASSHYP